MADYVPAFEFYLTKLQYEPFQTLPNWESPKWNTTEANCLGLSNSPPFSFSDLAEIRDISGIRFQKRIWGEVWPERSAY